MNARHVTIRMPTEKLDDEIKAFRTNVYGVLRECAGFKAQLFLVDRASGDTIGISLWDSEENMSASGEKLQAARAERGAGDREGAVDKRFYELALFETS